MRGPYVEGEAACRSNCRRLARLKLRLGPVDTSVDMGTTVPKKAGTPGKKAALIRDQVAASEVKYVGDWVDALVRSIEALRVPARDDPALHKVRADLDAASVPPCAMPWLGPSIRYGRAPPRTNRVAGAPEAGPPVARGTARVCASDRRAGRAHLEALFCFGRDSSRGTRAMTDLYRN